MRQVSRINILGLIGLIGLVQIGLVNGQTIQNCEIVKNGICLSCVKGFALNSTRKACITSPVTECIYVNAYNKCIECSCGLVVNEAGTQCISSTIEGCRQVNNSKSCIQAKPFYMITPEGVKYNMNTNCKRKSNIWNTADCAQCHEGYYLLNGRCVEITNITDYVNTYAILFKIDYTTNTLTFDCQAGWYSVNSGTTKGCFLSITNCSEYSQSGNLSVCKQCDTEFISVNGGQSCTKETNKIENCIEIDSISSYKCVRCSEDSLILSAPNTCTTRVSISGCSEHNPSQDKCIVCDSTHYLSAPDTCTTRVNNSNCQGLDPIADKCTSCTDQTKFYLDSTTKQCLARQNTSDLQCLTYDSTKDACSQCTQNYYLSNGVCTIRSTANCIQGVADQDKCTLCEADYLLKQVDSTCKKDSLTKKCLSIDSSGICTKCIANYGITQSGTNCIDNFQNIPMCRLYTRGNSTTCDECESGFLLTFDKLQCLISYGSCLQKSNTCNSDFIANVASYENYKCNPAKLTADQSVDSVIKQFSVYVFTILILIISYI